MAAAAAGHRPWVSATVAVVMPQKGHGMPVSARQGQGSPWPPVWAMTAGYTRPAAPAQAAARVARSGAEYPRRSTSTAHPV